MKEIRGWHVLSGFVLAFGVIISVNLTLAVSAVRTFPGLEVKNSYVASQGFQLRQDAQEALDWRVGAWVEGNVLFVQFMADGSIVEPTIESAIFGSATHVGNDQHPVFEFDGTRFIADIMPINGNSNLRIVALASDGTLFQQRIIVGDGK